MQQNTVVAQFNDFTVF